MRPNENPSSDASELFAPLVHSLTEAAHNSDAFSAAHEHLLSIIDILEDAADEHWCKAAGLIADLLKLAEQSNEGVDGIGASDTTSIVAEASTGVALLQSALEDFDDDNAELLEFIESAELNWSDYLVVIRRGDDWSSEAGSNELPMAADEEAKSVSEPVQQDVNLILKALGGMSLPTATPQAATPPRATAPAAIRPAAGHTMASPTAASPINPSAAAMSQQAASKAVAAPSPRASSKRVAITPPPQFDVTQVEPIMLEAFREDADNCLAAMEQAVLSAETQADAVETARSLGRELHTLKGASASVGLSQLANYFHGVEEWLDNSANWNDGLDGFDGILSSIDSLRTLIMPQSDPQSSLQTSAPIANELEPPAAAVSEEVAAPQTAIQPPTQPSPPTPPQSVMQSPPESAQQPAPQPPPQSPPQTAPQSVAPAVSAAQPAQSGDSVKVPTTRVDHLMDLLAELVMLRSRRDERTTALVRAADELFSCVTRMKAATDDMPTAAITEISAAMLDDDGNGAVRNQLQRHQNYLLEITNDLADLARTLQGNCLPLAEENRTLSHFVREFRHELMELRRMPVAGLFQRLQRVVRDAARVEGKQVRLQLQGEHAGLERSTQEKLYEPLLHLVRNAVSHGIESEDQRRAAGKDAVGTITLEAMGSTGMLIIEVRDDGGGLDFTAIRRRGVERGLITPDQQCSEKELARLIFHPGFSTREQTNQVAGRGVGMDVVAAALERMHSRIEIDSKPGHGTVIRLAIPLRSIIEHAMVVRSGGQLFALPIALVKAAGTAQATSTNGGKHVGHAEAVVRRLDEVLQSANAAAPLPESSSWLIIGDQYHTQSHGDSPGQPAHGAFEVRAGGADAPTKLLVDEILGPEEIVVRTLPLLFRDHSLIAGVTLSGANDTVYMLNGSRLLERCSRMSRIQNGAETTPASTLQTRRRALVTDDSVSARRNLVNKLERHAIDVDEAEDGLVALDRLRAEDYDMVFTDLDMPRMGGRDLLAEIKANPKTRKTPVVVVSSHTEPAVRDEIMQLGAGGYLVKAVTESSVNDVLKQLESAFTANE